MHIVLFRQQLNKKMQQMKMNQNRSMIMKMMRLAMMIKVAVDLVHSTQKTHIPILLLWKARATHSTARTTASLNIILFDLEISLLNPPITIASSTASSELASIGVVITQLVDKGANFCTDICIRVHITKEVPNRDM